VVSSYCPLEQAYRTVRVPGRTDPQVPARNTRATAEKLRYRKRESQHGFSFFQLAEKTRSIIEEVKYDPSVDRPLLFSLPGEICRGIAELERDDNSEKRGILVTNRLPVHAGTWRYGEVRARAISLQVSLIAIR
jgi:hypothetical protein